MPSKEILEKLYNKNGIKIEFRNVFFSYKEGNIVFKDLSFLIYPKESVAFVGHSGVGKSTIIKLLMRFYEVQKGEILINDINIKDIPKKHFVSS